MSTSIEMPPIGDPPIPGLVRNVLRKPGQFAAAGEPVVDLELRTNRGVHVLRICAPESGKVLRCPVAGETIRAGQRVVEVTAVGTPTFEVFVAYRQSDSSAHAGRVADHLLAHFGSGEVFKDNQSLRPGQDLRVEIRERLQHAVVMVIVMGPGWASDVRLQDASDLHREEVRIALERGIEILPVLVNGATMPGREALPEQISQLSDRIAIELRDSRWHSDICYLRDAVDQALEDSPARKRFLAQLPPDDSQSRWQWIEDRPS